MSYESGVGGNAVNLGIPASCGDPSGLRSHKWSYELGYRSVTGLRYKARELAFSYTGSYPNADALRGAADSDIAAGKPGVIEVDGWRQRAYIVGQTPAAYQHGRLISSIDVLLLDGFWWRETSKMFMSSRFPNISGAADGGLGTQAAEEVLPDDYPTDYGHDYAFMTGTGGLTVSAALGGRPMITFYGPVTNPYVVIGDNRYEVDVRVDSGCRVVIDARGSTPTVTLYDAQGNASSAFAYALRGEGQEAFAPIPQGEHEVTWSDIFEWRIVVRELETEPPWCL